MSDFFVFTTLLSAVFFVLGFISPKVSLFWEKDPARKTRLRSAGIYSLVCVASFIGFGLNRTIPIPEMKEPNPKKEQSNTSNSPIKKNTESDSKEEQTDLKYIPELVATDVYTNFTNKGFKKNFVEGSEGKNWICTKENQSFQFVVDIFGDDDKISQVKYSSLAYDGDATQVANDFLINGSSLIFKGEDAAQAQKWVAQNIGQNASIEISGVRFQLIANARVRILNVSVE